MKKILALLTWGDRILIIVLLISTSLSYAWVKGMQAEGNYAVVMVGNREIARYSLSQPRESIPVVGAIGEAELQISQGRIRMSAAPCPNKTCLGMGWQDKAGELIVCLPNQVVVRIEGAVRDEGLDGISR
jgi:hypothetical protein